MIKSLTSAALLALAATASQADTADHDFAGYDLNLSFASGAAIQDISSWWITGNTAYFSWTIPTSVEVSTGGGSAAASFALPDFTVAADAGYTVGSFMVSFGNLAAVSVGTATHTAGVSGMSDYAGAYNIGGSYTMLNAGFIESGIIAGSGALGGSGLSSAMFSGNAIDLAASGTASVFSQGQSTVVVSLVLTPVPEPETYALFAAGLVALGLLARRRG